MANIRDVAKEANVSVATVSRVINRLPHTSKTAIKAVNEAMKKLGYNPTEKSKSSNAHSAHSIGVLVADVSNSFYGLMVKAVDKVAREQKRQILISHGYHNADYEREAIELLVKNRCESLVVHAKGLSDEELIKFADQIPGLVIINRHIPAIADRCISLDNVKGSYQAVSYLIQQGHKNIGYLASSHNIDDSIDRKAGFRQALVDNNLKYSDALVVSGEPDEAGGAEAMSNLLAKNLPITAVATYNDFMAAGAISVLRANNIRVPEDISIIGYDDAGIATYLQPQLTTVRYPIQIMAEQAAMLAIELASMQTPDDAANNVYIPTLVPRDSVAKQ
ncbi:LacI family DNA-binding transcriptional regulator [Photobacterium gaetbulicola]|uniref:LacI family transcriptional regulator n=1 Tax=Photobacterium gaetbulicola Gung47 TaxID=658445 RepID=A0A0C5WJR4_9GAMM|nr:MULTISPECIES: substrate-binding domain-containing protein [Photobacterium]AJR05339.1 LacI family transcriptional regulator [Photobacterium gaetbulicola Gung47]PSU12666.1 LacI family DNA-binding transcriptional regulator [Photobacterium gaetbulicola]WEM44478.1 substrate-binding domain-containing protein [Photobacterium sp. DA100]